LIALILLVAVLPNVVSIGVSGFTGVFKVTDPPPPPPPQADNRTIRNPNRIPLIDLDRNITPPVFLMIKFRK
jgi:hypothetical protein